MPPVKRPPRDRNRTYIREWRDYREKQQDAVAAELDISASTLSRLETGKSPYDQDVIERLAIIYRCDPEDLISINPLQPDPPRLIYDRLKAAPLEIQKRALEILEVILKSA